MKKYLPIYFVILLAAFSFVSCDMEDEDAVELSPYAFVKSFKIGNIRSSYPAFTSDGRDTTVVRTMSMESFSFTIDQLSGQIYNSDSLPFCTNISKVVANISCEGILSIYVDSADVYEAYSSTDSIDFTSPRKLRVYSLGGESYKDYTVTVNVHRVEPEKMEWTLSQAVEGVAPERALEVNSTMYLFGKDSEGVAVVANTSIEGEPVWSIAHLSGLPAAADLTTIHLFKGMFYAVAEGCVYSSVDAVAWNLAASESGAIAIVGASDEDGKLWIAGEQGLFYSTDGVAFDAAGDLPANFPLYGVSTMSYPLKHNNSIIRYVLVGYATEAKDGEVYVWNRLSTEEKWTCYNNTGNEFVCPALKGLAVLHYDGHLFAFGGAGTVCGKEVEAFNSFYVSKDNGIVWKEYQSFYQRLPKELKGDNAPFAVAVDSRNYMWIMNSGTDGGVRKGIINRLGFQK